MTTPDPTYRPAKPGELCDCGKPAVVVHLTEAFGEVPACETELPLPTGVDPTTILDHVPAAQLLERIATARRVIAESGLLEQCETLHREVRPVWKMLTSAMDDDRYDEVVRATGYEELPNQVVTLAASLLDALGLSELDLPLVTLGNANPTRGRASSV